MNRDSQKRGRRAFVPSVDGSRLEERVVLNASPSVRIAAAQAAGRVTAQQSLQVRALYGQQFRAATNDLRNFAVNQLVAAYNDAGLSPGDRLTAEQYNALQTRIAGAVNATAIRLSTQYGLLPGTSGMIDGVQNALLGNSRQSLLGRLNAIANSGSSTRSEVALKNAVVRAINNTFQGEAGRLARYFDNVNFNRALSRESAAAVSASAASATRNIFETGNPLQAFMVSQALGQFNNNLAGLSAGIGNAALGALYGGNVNNPLTADTSALNAFKNQVSGAIGNLNYQFGSGLSVIPGVAGNTQLFGQLQQGIFGNGTAANPGLSGGVFGLTNAQPNYFDYFNGVNPAFTNAYQGIAQPVYSTAFPGFTVPNPNRFGPDHSYVLRSNFTGNDFFNGFNNGFGTGFTGFGTAPAGFDSNFSTGFNNFTTGFNSGLGLNTPNFDASIPGSDPGVPPV